LVVENRALLTSTAFVPLKCRAWPKGTPEVTAVIPEPTIVPWLPSGLRSVTVEPAPVLPEVSLGRHPDKKAAAT